MSTNAKLALVTGANRGLGVEIARGLGQRGLRVLVTARAAAAAESTAADLVAEGIEALHHPLDVTDAASVARVAEHAEKLLGGVDVLVNNAGVFLDAADPRESTAMRVPLDRIHASFDVNTLGALRTSQAFVPAMCARGYGRVVNVGSFLGQLSTLGSGWPAYRLSKAALGVVTRLIAAEVAGTNVLVNAGCPGRIRTRMGGSDAPRSAAEGADTLVWLATLPDGGPTGKFFRDRQLVEW